MVDDLNRKFTPAGGISDELLSAYLDGEVTAEERTLVERTLATSSEAAWRLDSLRQTVALVGQLPRVPLPRSFTLREADVQPAARGGQPWWRALLSPVFLRNATAVATMLFLVVLIGDFMVGNLSSTASAPAPTFATVVVEAPAAPMQMAAEEAVMTAGSEDVAAKAAPSPQPGAVGAGAAADTAAADQSTAAAEPAAAVPAAPIAEATAVPETAREAETVTLAESAPAVEITGAAQVVPDQGAAPLRGTETTSPPWLDIAAIVLGGLAVLLFVAWQLSARSQRVTH